MAQHHFKTEGKVLVNPGWMAIYGKEAAEDRRWQRRRQGQPWGPCSPAKPCARHRWIPRPCKTKPPARCSEATLLGAMEGAGKLVEDDELRSAMQEKAWAPATRAASSKGCCRKYHAARWAASCIPTAKAFQLMTLLRGLAVQELVKARADRRVGNTSWPRWGGGRSAANPFMREIADMTERMVQKPGIRPRHHPGNYATLTSPCPSCDGVVKENYRRYACTGADGYWMVGGFSFGKIACRAHLETAEAEAFLRDRHIGPLDGFPPRRLALSWPR